MRISVSTKVLAVVGCLAATSMTLGVTAYVGLKDLRVTGERVATVKDFEIQVGRLAEFNRARRRPESQDDPRYRRELERARALAAEVSRIGAALPPRLRGETESLQQHVTYVEEAFRELFARYEAETRLREQERVGHARLFRSLTWKGTVPAVSLAEIHEFAEHAGEVVDDHRQELLPGMREVVSRLRARAPSEVAEAAEDLLTVAEKGHLNSLAVQDRERFLSDTFQRFSELAGQAVQSLSDQGRRHQANVRRWLYAAMAAAALATVALWRRSLSYVNDLLRSVRDAAHAISAGRYEYALPPSLPEDETGDLLVLLQRLSRDLGRNIDRVADSEARYRSLVEGISDVVWEVGPDGRVAYASPVLQAVLGLAPEEARGRPPGELFAPEDSARVGAILAGAAAAGVAGRFEAAALAREGRRVVLDTSWQPVPGAGGEAAGLRAISRDVTERRLAEEEQARLRAQLVRAQKLEAVGTLAGGVAHDFNNLLQSLSGYVELLLLRRDASDPDYGRLKAMETAVGRAAELTRSLLLFSRKADSHREVLNLNTQIAQVRQLLERTIPRMIEVREELAPDLQAVEADPSQIEQVLVNLALNARDAMPAGGVLTFETGNVVVGAEGAAPLPPGRYVRVGVRDTGVGMTPEVAARIFEPFFTTKEVGKGTGLGLSTAYGIVQAHGGHIGCESSPGGGTLFEVVLPVARDTVSVREPVEEARAEVRGGTETILLVDDESGLCELGAEILAERGYRVLTALSGEAALEVLAAGEPVDLVVLDLNMPGMGGLECLREIAARHPGLRVVVASGYPPGEVRPQLVEAGARAFVRKPYRIDQLLSTLRDVLDAAT